MKMPFTNLIVSAAAGVLLSTTPAAAQITSNARDFACRVRKPKD